MMSFFKELIQMSFISVPIILAVLTVRLCIKKVPSIFSYMLWGIVLFRLLCPLSFTSDFSFIGLLKYGIPEPIATESTVINEKILTHPIINNELPGNYFTDGATPAEPVYRQTPATDFYSTAFYIWFTGATVLILYSLISYILLKRRLIISSRMFDNIYAADHIPTPFVIGIIRPKIYLPSGIAQNELDYIIAHEKHHIKRKDHIIKLISFSVLCLHWFNPLVWLSFSLAVRDMEMSCDEAVTKRFSAQERADYSKTLLSLSVSRRRFSPSPIAFGEGNTKMRIKNIMIRKKPTLFVVSIAIIMCIVTALFLISDPSFTPESPFGITYDVCEITYHASNLSMIVTMETAPKITLTSDNAIVIASNTNAASTIADIKSYGPAGKIVLTEENFDNYFSHTSLTEFGWRTDSHSAQKLRKNNLNTWQFIADSSNGEGNSFYILQQKNGDIYFAIWEYDKEREQDPLSDDSFIHTLYQLIPVSEKSVPEYTYDFSDAKTYMYHESIEAVMKPTISISEKSKTFHFTYSMFSSYIAHGHYSENGDRLIMDCGDGKIFTFRKSDDDTLIFIEKESSPIPKYRYSSDSYVGISPVPDGAVFKNVDIKNLIIPDEQPLEKTRSALEDAVSVAILTNYGSDKPDGLIHTECHKILDAEEIHGLRTLEGTENITKKKVYTISMHSSYSVHKSELKEVSCDFAPAIIGFIINPDGSLTFDSYFSPGDEGNFRKRITNYFTEKSYREALDFEKYRDDFSKVCLERAAEILNGYGTDYSQIEGLIKQICSSPAHSSSPVDYINEHPEEYERLIKGENNTLGYCFSKFFAGNQTGLDGHIMAQACRAIIEKRGEILPWDNYMTGQDWFDSFLERAEKLEEKYTTEELELMFPGTFVLLGTISSHS